MKVQKFMFLTSAALATGLALSSCAGSAGSNGSGDGEGVPVGASDEQYQQALADMPETTLVFQASPPSPDAIAAPRSLEFKKRVEEASGGKIKIDIVWGQAIASHSELDDALVDGRVDIATIAPIYNPAEYPVNDAFVSGTTLSSSSPRIGDLSSNAAMLEVAWNSPELMDEFTSKGLHPLLPFQPDGDQLLMCTDPVTSPEDWESQQIRVSSASQSQQIEAIGATAVSVEFPEIYEALQRGTIDCAISSGAMAIDMGFLDVATHLYYPEDSALAPGALSVVAGSDYENLPMAAQQLIFDSLVTMFEQHRVTSLTGSADMAAAVRDLGGSIEQLDDSVVQDLQAVSTEMVSNRIENGTVPENFGEEVEQSLEKWRGIIEEMNLGAEGEFQNLDEWHDPEQVDLVPFAERVYQEVMQEHRPE